jgi:hypothetical protein
MDQDDHLLLPVCKCDMHQELTVADYYLALNDHFSPGGPGLSLEND